MRDKRMRDTSQRRTADIASASRRPTEILSAVPHIRALAIIGLIIRVALPALALDGREQFQPQAALPEIQITQVKALSPVKQASKTEVEIRWTAKVPRLTTLDEFDVLLEVHYSDGSRGVARNQQLKPTSRAILLSLATHPRANSTAVLRDFKASVSVRFRIASSFTVVHQVITSQSESVHASSGSSSASQPAVFITAAELVTQGCSPGYQCVDLKWTAAAPRRITINQFTASVDALHKDGSQTTDSRTVGAEDHQARLQVGLDNIEVNSMTVSLVTSFSLLDSKTAVKKGTFSSIG